MTYDPCPESLPLIVRAADGALTSEELRVLEAHVASCTGCAEALADQSFVHAAVKAMPQQKASPFFAARVRARLGTVAMSDRRSWSDLADFRRWTWRMGSLTAVLAIATAVVATQSDSGASNAVETATTAEELPASAALWSASVSDTGLLAVMLQASPDDLLSDALVEASQ